jgi:hypothetical protein
MPANIGFVRRFGRRLRLEAQSSSARGPTATREGIRTASLVTEQWSFEAAKDALAALLASHGVHTGMWSVLRQS